MKLTKTMHHPQRYLLMYGMWTLLAFLMGSIGGTLGDVFHHTLHFVTHLRTEHPWLIWLLPMGGLLTVGIYHISKLILIFNKKL